SGERAARVAVVADGLDAARARSDHATAAADALRAEHGVTTDRDALAHQRTAVTECLAAVRHRIDLERALPGRRRAITDAVARGTLLTERLADLDTALDARPAERARIVEDARAAAALAAGSEAARLEVERVRALRADLVARAASERRVQGAEQTVVAARATAHELVRVEQQLRERRIAGLAGELGAALLPGDPCPVCGATEHPVVATPQDDHPTTEAIEAAAERARGAERALGDAATALALERAELARLVQVLGDVDDDTVDALAAAADAAVTAAHDAAVRVRDLEQQRAAHDEGTRTLERQRNEVDAERAVLAGAAAADAERLEQDESAVSAAIERVAEHLDGAPETLRQGVESLDALVGRLDAVLQADSRADSAAADVRERAAEVDRVLTEQGFDDVVSARAGVLDRADAEALRAEVARADQARAVVDAGLAEPAVVAAADDDPAALDLDGARAARDATAAAAEAAVRAATSAVDQAVASERCAAELDAAVRARDDTSARSRAVVRLADVAAGVAAANPTGITLGTYVLMRRFEDVVAAANDRLRAMLAGRFTLETSDERESGSRARRTGLALAVHDQTTDTVRDPRSLSGGETFTVSLCLALGLADVVQAEAGGVSLGTLFVDEGFGTLDPETLDDVIGQLSRLTAGGRQVGIVSHVEELKQRIPERIAVRRTSDGGSRVTTTV
ncbi:SbcC/MukB-like Walker B domain-containing protein, partial [Curtobacterium sp. CT11-133]|uniref:SbcC/MukB-like Walker B domain-containing protein n=1 Tax=Curtobacterium sp. CT11-133 TaxID=3243014 RepID=UPI0039B10275